jgi:hypothetical protein
MVSMIEADLRDQAPKASPPFDTGARLAEIVVDDQHPLGWPAQLVGARHQAILEPGRLMMIEYLLRGGLTDVHDGQTVVVPGLDLVPMSGRI